MILMVLKHRRPLPTPEEAMHDLLEEETTTGLAKELGDACRRRKRAQEGGNNRGNDERISYQCGLLGHVKVDCISYKRIEEWWRVKKATATTAALATTGDCDTL